VATTPPKTALSRQAKNVCFISRLLKKDFVKQIGPARLARRAVAAANFYGCKGCDVRRSAKARF
jgi:hypothetical protein